MTINLWGPLVNWSGITIVTGTDTDVGKTVATASLVRELLDRNLLTCAVKPVQTGVSPTEDGDVHRVAYLSGLKLQHVAEFARLADPLAPTTAAIREHVSLPSVADMADRIATLAQTYQAVVVEGAGGIHVGLDNHRLGLLALAAELRRRHEPVRFVVVARAGLGTLNHTQLTVDAIRRAEFEVTGIVIGSWPQHPSLAERCNLAEIAQVAQAPLLAVLPEGLGDAARAQIPSISSCSPNPKLSEPTL